MFLSVLPSPVYTFDLQVCSEHKDFVLFQTYVSVNFEHLCWELQTNRLSCLIPSNTSLPYCLKALSYSHST